MSRLQLAIDQNVFARNYTLKFLTDLPDDEYFRRPPGGVTHIAWQIGHLAMAQYRLALVRMRGERPDDEKLISTDFLKLFSKGSVPDADPNAYPPLEEIRAVFDRVHQQTLKELALMPDEELDKPIELEHSLVKIKLPCLHYCGQHEMIHAGQIALIRRLLGHEPVW